MPLLTRYPISLAIAAAAIAATAAYFVFARPQVPLVHALGLLAGVLVAQVLP
jgi:hypothetical protein